MSPTDGPHPEGEADEQAAVARSSRGPVSLEGALFFEQSPDLLAVTDEDGAILAVSPSARRILGVDPGDLVGRSYLDLVHPEDRKKVANASDHVLAGGELRGFEARFRSGDDGWAELRLSVTADLERGRVYAVAREPSGKLHDRLEAKRWEARFDAVFEAVHEGVLALSMGGRVRRANPAACRILAIAQEELVGRDVGDLFVLDAARSGGETPVPETPSTVRLLALRTEVGGQVALRGDASPVPVLLYSIPIASASSDIFLGFVDLSRQRQEEARRHGEERSRKEAEMRLAVASELHDGVLQTLTAIGLQLEVAALLVPSAPTEAHQRLQRLIELVRAEQRELRLYVDELKLDRTSPSGDEIPSLIERLSAMLDRLHGTWGISSDLVAVGDLPAEEAEVARTVLRLVQESGVNAARHGGASHLAVRVVVEPKRVMVTLRDDGHGFRFRGFFSDQELREQRLGPLSLKRRVRRANGQMSIRSGDDGAEVTFEIPRELGARRE